MNLKHLLIVVILAAIIGGGILAYQYWWLPKEEGKISTTEGSRIKLPDEGIVINKEIEGVFNWPYQVGDSYYYEIDKDIRIVFIRREETEGSFPNGDVILEKDGKDFILLSDTELFGPGGESFKVYTTNIPNILLVRFGAGDMGWWISGEYYVDLTRKEILFTLEDDQGYSLTVAKKGIPTLKLDLRVIDKCGDLEERTGRKAQIVDLLLNGQATNVLQKPIEVDCIDPGGIGSIYNPDFYLVKRKVENDFSQLHFDLIGTRREDGAEREVWKEEFYIPLTNINDIKIYGK